MTYDGPMEWTRQDLELYRDDALDPAVGVRLTESLRESPELRERLTAVARVDALARAALLREAMPVRFAPIRRWAVAAVAIVGIGVGVTAFYPRSEPTELVVAAAPAAETPASLVVWSFPARGEASIATAPVEAGREGPAVTTATIASGPSHAVATPSMTAVQFGRQLDAALARADAMGAADLLTTSDEALRVEGYRRLGAALRSLSTARRVLEELPVGEQLAACRELAVEPRWRTVAVTRLTTLHDDPANRAAVEALLAELARSPELAPLVERIRSSGARRTESGQSI